MSVEEIYQLMDERDKIQEGMGCNWPYAVYIALDELRHIVAAGSYDDCSTNSVYHKAVSRACLNPAIYQASRVLSQEAIDSHNSALEKALSIKKTLIKK